jgi:SCY1-like protein 2
MVSERITGSLANLLKDKRNLLKVPDAIQDVKLSDLDIMNGIRLVAGALQFCHREAKTYHRYIDPVNIYITPTGDWKLGGFYFSAQVESQGELIPNVFDYTTDDTELANASQPSLFFLAPELGASPRGRHADPVDAFAVGMLAYTVHRFAAGHVVPSPPLDVYAFERHISELHRLDMTGVPDTLLPVLRYPSPLFPSLLLPYPVYL